MLGLSQNLNHNSVVSFHVTLSLEKEKSMTVNNDEVVEEDYLFLGISGMLCYKKL